MSETLVARAEAAFLPEILASYTDDGPRLMLADYLAESLNAAAAARAEFIRIQLALARLSPDHPRWPELTARQTDLLQAYEADWAAPLAGIATAVEFRRGLLDSIAIDARRFLDLGVELFRLAPIRRVRLLDVRDFCQRIAQCPALAHLRELDLCGSDLGSGGLAMLLRSPYLTRLHHLDLSFTGLDDAAMLLLARTRSLPRLRQLLMTDNGAITGQGIRMLSTGRCFPSLVSLDLAGNAVDELGVQALVTSRVFPRLRQVQIHANPLGDVGVANLINSSRFSWFIDGHGGINLRHTRISATGAISLASSPSLRRVIRLDLSGNNLGNRGLAAIAYSPHLPRLRHLSVCQAEIYDDGAALLADSPLMRRLQRLDITENYLSSQAISWLYLKRRNWKTVLETWGNAAASEMTGITGPADDESRLPEAARFEQLRRRYLPEAFRSEPRPRPVNLPESQD